MLSCHVQIKNCDFPAYLYPLYLLQCLTALAKMSSTIMNGYGDSRHPCPAPDFNGTALSFFLFKLILAVGLLENVSLASLTSPELLS